MDNRPIILVVEDESLIGLMIQDSLEDAGYQVRLIDCAIHALDELESGADALNALVTDIRLQDRKDGWRLARRARELNPLLPVVYMSGDSAVDHPSEGVPQAS